jgi:ferritin
MTMMISKKMADKINLQIKNEFHSGWLYEAMAYSLEEMNLPVFAKWFLMQAEEERKHATKLARYLVDQGAKVVLTAIPAPKTDFKTVEEICKMAVDHEKKVTKMIHDLHDAAAKENDKATMSMLIWFIDEQVEEVSSTTQLLEMVKLAKSPGQILMLEGRVARLIQERD